MAKEVVATTQRISLMVPDALYQDLDRLASSRYGATVPELVRSFIVKSAEDGHERELFLL